MLRRFVLTGAPGAGKTALGHALVDLGFSLVAEAATDVIAIRQAGGIAEPWVRDDFLDAVVDLQHQRQVEAGPDVADVDTDPDPVIVFDRSPLCTLALARYQRRPVTPLLALEVDRISRERTYQQQVFLVLPLGFIVPTAARRIGYEDSLRFHAVHHAVYREHGFHLVDVPPAPVSDRAASVAEHITSLTRARR